MEKINDAKINLAKVYINEIRKDIKGINEEQFTIFGKDRDLNYGAVYFLLFYDLSKRGISDIFDFSKELYENVKKYQLDFTKKSVLELCDIWETFINEHNFYYNKFIDLYNKNKKNISLLYSKYQVIKNQQLLWMM